MAASPPPVSGREFFRQVYDSYLQEYRQGGRAAFRPQTAHQLIYPDPRKYVDVFLRPNGDVMGPWYHVLKFARECGMTGTDRRGGPTTVQVHHLLEDRLMEHFGVPRRQGFCVTLEKLDHDVFSAELPHLLPRGDVYFDLDVVYDAHCAMYRDHGQSDWIPFLRTWLRQWKSTILARYHAGLMRGATGADIQRVRTFLNSL